MNKLANFFLKKYLTSGKKEIFRLDNIFLILGIIISVSVLTISLAIFDGYQTKLKETILGVNSHIYIFRDGNTNLTKDDYNYISKTLEKNEAITAFTPLIESNLMAIKNNRIKGCILKGLDTKSDNIAFNFHEYVKVGKSKIDTENGIVIGNYLAKELNVTLNDSINLVSPLQTKYSIMGLKQKKIKAKIVGIFESGMHTYDAKYLFSNLEFSDKFNSTPNEFSLIGVKVLPKFIDETDRLAMEISFSIGNNFQVRTWQEFNSSLFRLIALQKWLLFILLSFLVVVASFNIISTISTMIMNKREEIGILKAYGTSDSDLYKIFLGRTIIISSFAIISGIILGIVLSYIISVQHFYQLNGEVYFLEKIYVRHNLFDLLAIVTVSHIIIFITALIPLRKLKKMEIIKIIREKE